MSQPARRQSRPPAQGDWGIAVPLFAGVMVIALLGFWPAMVWHGYGGPTGTGWRWDIHSTIAEAVYFGIVAFIIGLVMLGRRGSRPASGTCAAPAPRLPDGFVPPSAALAPPRCRHLDAVPVDLPTGERVAWWCEACETQLDAGSGRLMRPCCGSAPGTLHQYNCPHLKGSPS